MMIDDDIIIILYLLSASILSSASSIFEVQILNFKSQMRCGAVDKDLHY